MTSLRLLFVNPGSTSPVIPDLIRNPQFGKPKGYLEPWILDARRKCPWVRVQDDGVCKAQDDNPAVRHSVIPDLIRNPQSKATDKLLKAWILDARRKCPWVRVQDDNREA